jgi:type II secretory ATPase GspE/PulE/Tfp pilus assembly ATPase PilB-like protein
MAGADVMSLHQQARAEGIVTMRQDGMVRVQMGQTSWSEVESATHA